MKKLKRYNDYSDFGEGALEDHWCLADDVDELEESHQRLLDALKEIVEQTDGRNNSVMGQDRAYSIARAAIAKSDLDIHNL